MIRTVFALLFLMGVASAASAEVVNLNVGEYVTIGTTVVTCGANPPQTNCVPDCTARYPTGTCYQYGKDFCGVNVTCIAHCTARYPDGNCYEYGQDLCGTNPQCIKNCSARYPDGSCYQYGSDSCTTNLAISESP